MVGGEVGGGGTLSVGGLEEKKRRMPLTPSAAQPAGSAHADHDDLHDSQL
jgi:hypothetical protein